MADRNAWEPLVQNLAKFFPNISPQIAPGNQNARIVLQAIQSGLNKSHEKRTQSEREKFTDLLKIRQKSDGSPYLFAQCKWCGRVVSSDQEGFYIPDGSMVPEKRMNVSILTWQLDWTKRILKIKGLQFSCQECQLLLNLSKLLNFLLMLNNSTDNTKLYSLASHFCQINGHTSQSGEDDVGLLQQVVSVTHSLHVLTKNMPDLTIQGPNGEIITLDSVNEVVEYLSRSQVYDSIQSSTSKTKQKKNKETTSTMEANNGLDAHDSMPELKTSNQKKKKRRTIQDSLTNGHHTGDQEKDIPEGPAKKQLVLSEKRKKNPAGKVKLGKRRRSLPAMKLD